MIVDKLNPTSMTNNLTLSEEKFRKNFASKNKDLPNNSENKQQKKHRQTGEIKIQDLLKKVDEVNAYLTTMGQNILVLIQNNNEKITIKILNSKTHETITVISPVEFYEVAQNLRNEKLTLIDKDA